MAKRTGTATAAGTETAATGRKSPATLKMEALLADDPAMPVADVMSILIHDHLIDARERTSAERRFYKVRTRLGIAPPAGEVKPAKAPAPAPAEQPPTGVAHKPARKPARAPSVSAALDRAVGAATAAAERGADPDGYEKLFLTKQALSESVGLDPMALFPKFADLSQRVGGPAEVLACMDTLRRLDAIRPVAVAAPADAAEPTPL